MRIDEYDTLIENHCDELRESLQEILDHDPSFESIGDFEFLEDGKTEIDIVLKAAE